MDNKQKKIPAFLILTQVILASCLAFASINVVNAAEAALAAPTAAPATNPADKKFDSESFNVSKYLTSKEGSNKEGKGQQDQSYLKSTNPVASFIVQMINFLVLTIGSFSFLTIIIGGFTLLTSHGNENQVTKGKDILKYAVAGLVVALSAYFITTFVQSLFYELPK